MHNIFILLNYIEVLSSGGKAQNINSQKNGVSRWVGAGGTFEISKTREILGWQKGKLK